MVFLHANNMFKPLSPHLQIYKIQLTSVLSIMHRISGIGLAIGSILFFTWLYMMTNGMIVDFKNFISSYLAQFFVFWIILGGCYHFFNGIRHLLWDFGYLLDIQSVYISGYAVLVLTVLSTFIVWFF
ncbi:MAG: succinate dehydrogenase, cytochrome b556 subunit [Proteobacteria bacterium]|nr:succinate dehydrogenase, cytochrome b556 subunit [Pseudomonadota bacterium]